MSFGERGVVYSTTTVHAREGAYNVCLVDLEDGARIMSTVAGIAPDEVRIGMAVRARADPGTDAIVFEPAGREGSAGSGAGSADRAEGSAIRGEGSAGRGEGSAGRGEGSAGRGARD